MLGSDGGDEGVLGEGGEVIEKGTEAVDWEAVLGSASGLLGNGGGRAPGFSDDAGALRFSLSAIRAKSGKEDTFIFRMTWLR